MNQNNLIIIILLLIPVFSLFWLPKDEILTHGIIPPWIDFDSLLNLSIKYSYAWFVGPNYDISSSLFYFYSAVLTFIGGSVRMGQSLFFYFGFLLCEISVYLLGVNLGFNKKASLVAGVIYLLSPIVYSGFPVEPVNLRVLPYYFSTPLLLVLLIKTLSSVYYKKYLAFLGVFAFFVSSIGYSSLQYFVLSLILVFSYALFYLINLIYKHNEIKKTIIKLFLFFLIIILSNAYWFLVFSSDLNASYHYRTEPGNEDVDTFSGLSPYFIDSLRMLPYPSMPSAYPFYGYYYSPVIIVIIFFFVFLSVINLLSKNKIVVYLWFSLLIVLFLESGITSPFGDINSMIFLSVSYITRLFRNLSYLTSLAVMFFSLLVGLGFDNIYNFYKKSNKLLILFTLTVVLFGIPFFTGMPLSYYDDKPAQSVVIPDYLTNVYTYLNKEPIYYHIIELPTFTNKLPYVILDFNKTYWGGSPLLLSSNKMNIQSIINSVPEEVLVNSLHPTKDNIDYETWLKILQITNVKHVIFYNNTDWNYLYKTESIELSNDDLYDFVINSNLTDKTYQFGDVIVFSLKDEYFTPVIYSGNEIFVSNLSLSNLSLINTSLPIIIFNSDKQLFNETGLNYSAPDVTFKRINPTKYRVLIHNATSSFPLVFSERFYGAWTIYVKDYKFYEDKDSFVSDSFYGVIQNDNLADGDFYETWNLNALNVSHFEVNGYSNLWMINPTNICKEINCSESNSFELIIEYKPQKILTIGWGVSILSVLISLIYLTYYYVSSLISRKLLRSKIGKSR